MFEVITTVGYGDYAGHTQSEYVFLMVVEFTGLVIFSFLMNSVSTVFSSSDEFEDHKEDKLDNLDIWIKKIEKSNAEKHIHPILYDEVYKDVEQAIFQDFNMLIEDFDFYY